jgi:hypothetical protein
MIEEKLPIKFFASRDVDSQRTEGGGSTDNPKWVYCGDELEKHAQRLLESFNTLTSLLTAKEETQSPIPLVIKAKFVDKAKAKSHRREIRNLFKSRDQDNILGLVESDEVIIKIENNEHANKINNKLKDYESNKYALSCLSSLEAFKPRVFQSSKEEDTYKVKLIDYQDYELNLSISRLFEQELKTKNIEFYLTKYSRELTIYRLNTKNKSTLDELRSEDIFEAIFSIEPMPKYLIQLDQLPSENYIKILKPDDNIDYVKIGFLDNGISPIPHLKPWIIERWSPYPRNLINSTHGTFVSGVAIYGDTLESENWVGNNGFKILDAAIYPDTNKEGLKEDELINNIQEVIREYGNKIKIWNLCISIKEPINEDSFWILLLHLMIFKMSVMF